MTITPNKVLAGEDYKPQLGTTKYQITQDERLLVQLAFPTIALAEDIARLADVMHEENKKAIDAAVRSRQKDQEVGEVELPWPHPDYELAKLCCSIVGGAPFPDARVCHPGMLSTIVKDFLALSSLNRSVEASS